MTPKNLFHAKSVQHRKNILFNEWCWDNWISTCKRMKLNPFLILHTKINSKCIRDLKVRAKTIKLLEENIGVTLHGAGLGKAFLDVTSKAQQQKKKNKLDFIKIKKKNFCDSRDIKKVEGQPTPWNKIFANHISHVGLVSRNLTTQ